MKKLIKKYKELIMYVIFGVGTIIVNFTIFFLLTKMFRINYVVTNIIAWIAAVLFAYITNKKFVFEDKGNKKKVVIFFSSRIISLAVEIATLIFFINIIGVNENISKIIISFFVVILNYILSKFLIFKKEKEVGNDD